jgi:hypothetical protein
MPGRVRGGRRAAVTRRPFEVAPARQHALEHGIAFDKPMVERGRDMERDDHADQNPADEMPDENAV